MDKNCFERCCHIVGILLHLLFLKFVGSFDTHEWECVVLKGELLNPLLSFS